MNRNSWLVIAIICVLGLGALIFLTKKDSVNTDNLDPSKILESSATSIGDHVYGKKDAKVVVFEYADFQCPGCGGAHTNTPRIQELYKDKVAFVFRNYPLITIHPNALAAASVAEAANLQGKYWEMNNLLFERRTDWVNLAADKRGDMFLTFASQLGLNIDQFKSDLTSSKIETKIRVDRSLGDKAGVSGTPSFHIGKNKMNSTIVDDVIKKEGTLLMDAIDQALKDAGETPPVRQ